MVESYSTKRELVILYASQTGNAEDMAKRIGYRAKSLGYTISIQTMDDFQLVSLPKLDKPVIFVCSTTGHGQEPENMKRFYNFIRRRDLPKDCLKNLQFAVYGLGDSSYAKFNYVSKILFKRLTYCGAQAIQELVLGDEQHHLGCDGMIYPRLEELFSELNGEENAGDASDIIDSNLPESSYEVEILNQNDENLSEDSEREIFNGTYYENYDIKTGICAENTRLTPQDHFQDTRLFKFKSDNTISYEPGDVCAILPENLDENVDMFLDTLNLNPNQKFSIRKKDPNYMINYLYDFIPDGLSVRKLVKCYLDIQSVPKRSFFEFLWPFSDNELERDKLREFSTTDGQEEMYEYCIQPKRSILEVLLDFPHTVKNIKFEYLFDLIPPIKPRSFSIASSMKMHPNEIHLIVGIVKYQTRLRRTRRGLCSTYLSKLVPKISDAYNDDKSPKLNRIRFCIKSSAFKLPRKEHIPIVMIGPGLGIAPFRSFIQERSLSHGDQMADNNHLYFGCRFREVDFYFEQELKEYSDSNSIKLSVAFSREQEKCYVQDLLLKDSNTIKKLVDIGAIIYVAGNSKLPEDIRKVIGKILTIDEKGKESKLEEANSNDHGLQLVSSLEANNRIQYDCW